MREILFRAKAINRVKGLEYRTKYKNGDWVFGLLSKPYHDFNGYIQSAEMRNTDGVDGIDVDHETLGQFTGLYDKNGVKIFEGDILASDKYPYTSDGNQNYFAEVVWFDNCPAFGLYTFRSPESLVRGVAEGSEFIEDDLSDMEVIGNIHDNPELLAKERFIL